MPRNQNTSLLRALSNNAESLACAVAKNEFPVLLRAVAERRRVTSVEFRPLLVDAMLTTHDCGFRILFNSNGSDSSELRQRFEKENRDRLMTPRLRFSLAHELAHTLFYDLSETPPKVTKQFRSGGGKTVLENLERNCDKLAARMLLPTSMLRTALRVMGSISPQGLLQLAGRAGVSIETLVRRINDESSLLVERYFKGCIVLLEQNGNEMTVAAVSKPPLLNIARDLQLIRAGERLQLMAADQSCIVPSVLPAASYTELIVETAQSSSTQTYRIERAEIARFESTTRFLLTFEETDSPV